MISNTTLHNKVNDLIPMTKILGGYMNPNLTKKTWSQFRSTGLLWWINAQLHLFGWAIAVEYDDDKLIDAFPCRTKYRGFDESTNTQNYIKLTEYITLNGKDLLDDIKEVTEEEPC